ncbi:STM3941 family protein [Nocardia mangyaensis]|nr:STM3941 family protein [Nocardia mangyaensis]
MRNLLHEYKTPKKVYIRLIAYGLPLTLVSFLVAVYGGSLPELLFGSIGTVFFGGCLIAAIIRLLSKTPELILYKEGIYSFQTGYIPWTNIYRADVHTSMIGSDDFLELYLRDRRAYMKTRPILARIIAYGNRMIGHQYASISMSLIYHSSASRIIYVIHSNCPDVETPLSMLHEEEH